MKNHNYSDHSLEFNKLLDNIAKLVDDYESKTYEVLGINIQQQDQISTDNGYTWNGRWFTPTGGFSFEKHDLDLKKILVC